MAKTKAGSLSYDTKLDTKGFEIGLGKVGKVAGGIAKGVGTGIGIIAGGLTTLITGSVKEYANLEQSVGGVETLFKNSADKVIANAEKAYKTAGIDANKYMEQVTSFSASLLQSLGGDTKKAADYADQAIVDMADNSNKFGTDMELIQNAYQGFAKQNFTMLDNLKLGYGGTKEEMQRLIDDANKVKEANGGMADLSIDSFADITEAIHIVQNELDITGTTSKEASTTIKGSVDSAKAAFKNFLSGAGGIEEVIDTFVTAGTNIANAVVKLAPQVIDGIIRLIEAILPMLPTLLDTLLPVVLDGASRILTALIEMAPQVINTILTLLMTIVDTITQNLPMILQTGITILISLIQGIAEALPELIPTIVDCILLIVDTLIENIDLIIEVGIEIILALIEGIFNALPNLIAKLPELIIKLVRELLKLIYIKLPQAGRDIVDKIVDGLFGYWNKMIQKIREFFKGTIFEPIVNKITDMAKVGLQLVQGLWEGIKNARDWLLNKIKGFAKTITNGIKSFFGIHSPSKVMRDEIGKNLILGVGVAFEKDDNLIDKQINDFGDDVYKKMQGAVNMETGKMAFSGTSGSISQILSSNATFDGNFVVKAEVEEGTLFEANQRITRQKKLQTGFGG